MKNARGALRIFLQFLKFGCFTFGGGLNIIAQMQRLYVDEEKRISSVELLDLTSVARSLPLTGLETLPFFVHNSVPPNV